MNKKGGTIVEAAVIMPLVILSVISLIGILTFLNNQVITLAQINVALTKVMGEETDTVISGFKERQIEIYSDAYMENNVYRGSKDIGFEDVWLLKKHFSKEIKGKVYEVKEKKIIRYTDFIMGEN